MTARARALLEEMAAILVDKVPELGNDQACIEALLKAFAPRDIFALMELWDRLMRAEERDHDT